MRNTRLADHGLYSEGKPYEPADPGSNRWSAETNDGQRFLFLGAHVRTGVGVCECGWTTKALESHSQRQRAHADHKAEIRAALASKEQSGG